jgi:hypothetical protein
MHGVLSRHRAGRRAVRDHHRPRRHRAASRRGGAGEIGREVCHRLPCQPGRHHDREGGGRPDPRSQRELPAHVRLFARGSRRPHRPRTGLMGLSRAARALPRRDQGQGHDQRLRVRHAHAPGRLARHDDLHCPHRHRRDALPDLHRAGRHRPAARRGGDPQPQRHAGAARARPHRRAGGGGARDGELQLFHLARPARAAAGDCRLRQDRRGGLRRGDRCRREAAPRPHRRRGDPHGRADRRPARFLAHRPGRAEEVPGGHGGLVREALGEMPEVAAGRHRIDIGELPQAVADRSLLRQVWVNLLANAVKYSRQRIRRGSRSAAPRGRCAALRARQRRRLRHGLRRQAVPGVPAPAPRSGLRGHRRRPGHRRPHRPAPRRARLGRGRARTRAPPSISPFRRRPPRPRPAPPYRGTDFDAKIATSLQPQARLPLHRLP